MATCDEEVAACIEQGWVNPDVPNIEAILERLFEKHGDRLANSHLKKVAVGKKGSELELAQCRLWQAQEVIAPAFQEICELGIAHPANPVTPELILGKIIRYAMDLYRERSGGMGTHMTIAPSVNYKPEGGYMPRTIDRFNSDLMAHIGLVQKEIDQLQNAM